VGAVNHAALITGYTDDPAVPGGGYWHVKNSWGTGWGDDGYGYVRYGVLESHNRVHAITGEAYTAATEPEPLTNGGFETSELTGWYTEAPAGAGARVQKLYQSDTSPLYSPVEGDYFAALEPGGEDRYTMLSQYIELEEGSVLSGWAAFDSAELEPLPSFNDNAQVRIYDSDRTLVVQPWAKDAAAVGPNGASPWEPWQWAVPTTGGYRLEYRVANAGDDSNDSHALFDATLIREPLTGWGLDAAHATGLHTIGAHEAQGTIYGPGGYGTDGMGVVPGWETVALDRTLEARLGGSVRGPSLANGGFERATLAEWTAEVPPGGSATAVFRYQSSVGSQPVYQAVEGGYFALLKTDGPGSFTRLLRDIPLAAGDRLCGWAAFDAADSLPFNDSAHVRIYDATGGLLAEPWYRNVKRIGNQGHTDWEYWEWAALTGGTHTLEMGVANDGDAFGDSHAMFDSVGVIRESDDGDYLTIKGYYTDAEIAALGIVEETLRLYFRDGEIWRLACYAVRDEPSGGRIEDYLVIGPPDDYGLGYYGVDTEGNYVWGNVEHLSSWAIAGTLIPEPTTAATLALGLLALLRRRRSRG
jgi:hypothetical protein